MRMLKKIKWRHRVHGESHTFLTIAVNYNPFLFKKLYLRDRKSARVHTHELGGWSEGGGDSWRSREPEDTGLNAGP